MGIPRILGVCSALLFASSVSAANIIDLGPSDYRNYGTGSASHTGGGVRSSFGQTVRMPPTLNTLNVTRNPVIPYGSIANGLRNFTRITPGSLAASAAVTGLFLAVDWVFDQSTGEWSVYEDEIIEDPSFGLWTGLGYSAPTPETFCDIVFDSSGFQEYGPVRTELTSPTSVRCLVAVGSNPNFNLGNGRKSLECPPDSTYLPSVGACAAPGALVPVGQSGFDILEGELVNQPPQLVADAASDTMRKIGNPLPGYQDQTITGPSSFTGPQTTSTSTDPVTGDTIVTNTSTQTDITYGPTTITTTNTTTSTTYQNGQETGTTVTTETPGDLPVESGGGAGDWPGFCEWATVVCDWFDWTQEDPPPEQDLPAVIDDDFYQEKEISFGSKSCPPDHQIDLTPFLSTSVAVSFQPLCDFAGLIYYMVMAASYIIAAYITIGVARNG